MKKVFVLSIIGLMAIFTACNGTKKPTQNQLSGKTYRGIIPCADCSGIVYELTLNDDHTFEASSVYIGARMRPFLEAGTWKVKSDTLLILKQEDGQKRSIAIADSTLTLLDGNQNYITGPLANNYVLTLKKETVQKEEQWSQLRKRGVDFRASGNEPFWGLTIDFDGTMTFYQAGGDSIVVDLPQMKQDTASKARIFTAETKAGMLIVELFPTGCIDGMSGEVFGYGVNIRYGSEVYRGCGNYISPKYKLNDTWTLHSLNGTEIKVDSLMKTPTLVFDLRENRVYGNSGCNQITGGFEVQNGHISFSKLASTKMACPGSMDIENKFLQALTNVNGYKISSGVLKLTNGKQVLMVFYRAG